MDLIRKIILLSIFITGTSGLHSQETENIQDVFSKSYGFETVGDYAEAIKSLQAVYGSPEKPTSGRRRSSPKKTTLER